VKFFWKPIFYHNNIYIFFLLGSGPNLDFSYKDKGENDVLLLDISDSSNYVWTNDFNPNAVIPPQSSLPTDSSSTQYNNNKNNTPVIVGTVIGVVVVICITSLSIFYIIKRRKKIYETAIPTPSNSENAMPIPSDLELSSGK
jgi:hypothetical protein